MKALILCNGEQPAQSLFEENLAEAQIFIACDGAAHWALKYKRMPDIIIGDLDSIDPKLKNLPNIKFIDDQNSNDLEKALNLARDLGVKQACILGASGLRFDHFLCNLYILPRFAPHIFIRLVDNYGEAWIASHDETISAPLNTPISFFTLGDKPVTKLCLEGLKYTLNNARLEPQSPRASLNYFAKTHARIRHESGVLLIYAVLRPQA